MSVPSLEEAVTTLPEVSFVVDLKVDGLVSLLADLIERLSLHDRLIVGSFSDQRLDEFRKATEGRVATSTGPMLSRMWLLTSRVGRGAGGDASALQLPTQVRGIKVVDQKLVDTAHANGLQVHVWTVNDPAGDGGSISTWASTGSSRIARTCSRRSSSPGGSGGPESRPGLETVPTSYHPERMIPIAAFVLLAAVDLGAGFGSASAEVILLTDESMEVEVQVEVQSSAGCCRRSFRPLRRGPGDPPLGVER